MYEAIKTLSIRQESLKLVAPALFDTMKAKDAKYLHGENDTFLAWKHVMNYVDIGQDPFCAVRNSFKYPNLLVSNAGLKEVNGLYKLQQVAKDRRIYTNGVCILDFTAKYGWDVHIDYLSFENGRSEFTMFYSCSSANDFPPSKGWYIGYRPIFGGMPVLLFLQFFSFNQI